MVSTLIGVPLAAAVFLHCVGDEATVGNATPEAGTPDPGVDSATPGTDSATGTDAGFDTGVDPAACAARKVNEASAVFVNINGTDSAQCGSAAEPCQTVQTGINQAKTLSKTIVYIARGTYKESVNLAAGLTLEGGWDTLAGKWIPACDNNDIIAAAKLQMPDASNTVVTADFTGTGTLRYLSILGKAAKPAAGESVYGVFAKGASLAFESISVSVGPAGTGADGNVGSTGGTGATKCATGAGGAGNAGGQGGAAQPGTFGPTGYVPGDGNTGLSNGTNGANGTCAATCPGNEVTICMPNVAACGASEGCPTPLAGCGGTPGGGGGGGLGGGSSIAVFGWDATFSVNGGAFLGGNAGAGGAGGGGGPGGTGGAGTTQQVLCASCINGNQCATVGNQTIATGGQGGKGGNGGQGGGGAGGSSYGIYAGGTAGKITVVNAPLYQNGTAGGGGAPNGPAGAAGQHVP